MVDMTDISKRYARKMEYLARVRDGSRGKLRDGYWCCQVVAGGAGQRRGDAFGPGALIAGGARLRQ